MPHSEQPPDDFGERFRHYRARAGLTQATLAELVGRSPDWVKKIENGDRGPGLVDNTIALLRAADALGVSLPQLVGLTGVHPHNPPRHPLLHRVTGALAHQPVDLTALEPVTADHVRTSAATGWRAWHTQHRQRTAVALLLPDLIRDAKTGITLTDTTDRLRAYAAATKAFALAAAYLSFHSDTAASSLHAAAEWAFGSAQFSQDPRLMAAAVWTADHVRRETGDYDLTPARDASALLSPEQGGDELAMWGLLRLSMAVSCGISGHSGDALRFWDEARAAAAGLAPGYFHTWLLFNDAMVTMYGAFIALHLARPGLALRMADKVNRGHVSSWTRRGFLHIVAARAHIMQHDPEHALDQLVLAQRIAPEDVPLNPMARATVADLSQAGATRGDRRLQRLIDENTATVADASYPPTK